MTIQTGSTTREIIGDLSELNVQNESELLQVRLTIAKVAQLGNIEHRLEKISCYLASIEGQIIEGQIFKR